jgi:heme-degrading monooxygenase HmoA
MITEHAVLPVTPGQEDDFELAFAQARGIIGAAQGCLGVTLSRSVESPSSYLLLVEWESVEAHMVGFRASEAFQEWRALLHHFYATPPVVEHFEVVGSEAR